MRAFMSHRPLIARTKVASRTLRHVGVCLAFAAQLSPALAADTAQDARAWLERMSRAMATNNYDGRFVHIVGGYTENMRIIHRVDSGLVTERLISLDGSGRELVRNDSEVVCYLPDRRTVLVEKRTDKGSLLAAVPVYSEALERHYILSSPGTYRVLGRPAQYIVVQPQDTLRYGYRLWIDRETSMPLKSQLADRDGRVLEQIVFTELSTPTEIDPALLKTSIVTDGYRWMRQETRPQRVSSAREGAGWVVVNPPQGFRLTVTRTQTISGAAAPVRHLVLSDGLVSVSVFIEPRQAGAQTETPMKAELARVGAALAYSTDVADHRVTAVGEVPAATLRAIAAAVHRDNGPSPGETAPPEAAAR